jgi:phosphoglycolate phosphatase
MAWRRRFDAIVFDLDGTLVETAPDLAGALNHTLGAAGLPAVSVETVRHMIGDGARMLLKRGVAEAGRELDEAELERWFEALLEHYWHHVADQSLPFPGVTRQLARFRDAGLKLAVCTNKPIRLTEKLLELLDLAQHFDAVLGGDSLAVRKPDPEHILGTLRAIGSRPERAVMIGDSANDVAAARNAGLPVVVVSFGYTAVAPAELGADAVIDHFDELAEALAGLA